MGQIIFSPSLLFYESEWLERSCFQNLYLQIFFCNILWTIFLSPRQLDKYLYRIKGNISVNAINNINYGICYIDKIGKLLSVILQLDFFNILVGKFLSNFNYLFSFLRRYPMVIGALGIRVKTNTRCSYIAPIILTLGALDHQPLSLGSAFEINKKNISTIFLWINFIELRGGKEKGRLGGTKMGRESQRARCGTTEETAGATSIFF